MALLGAIQRDVGGPVATDKPPLSCDRFLQRRKSMILLTLYSGHGTPKWRGTDPATSRARPYIGFTFRCSPDPELVVLAWSAARRGISEATVAGVVGSFAYNVTMTLGAGALARPLVLVDATVLHAPLLLGSLALVTLLAARRGESWPRDFGQGDKLFLLERETGRYG